MRVPVKVAIVVTIVGVLAIVGAVYWVAWRPNHRPDLRAGESYGVDVSTHQGAIDWQAVRGDDISFAYIKATEGGNVVDNRFVTNWRAARVAGLRRGAYHFFTLCRTGSSQAANFLSKVPRDPTALDPAVDLELAGNCSRRPSRADLDRELETFVQTVEARTHQPMILYVGRDFEAEYHVTTNLNRRLWVRDLLRRPTGPWEIWQANDRARVNGIDTSVDLNVMRTP